MDLDDYIKNIGTEMLGIANHAKRIPEHPAIIMEDITVSYKELDKTGNILANSLLQHKIAANSRVSVLMSNCPEMIYIWHACGKIFTTPVFINYRFKEDEVAHIVNDSKSKILIYDHKFEKIISGAKDKIENSDLIYVCANGPAKSDSIGFKDLINADNDTDPGLQNPSLGMASSLIYTSGTTGRPKGVVRNSKNRLNMMLLYAFITGWDFSDKHIVAGPLCHTAPLSFASCSFLFGNPVVIMTKFDAVNFLELIQKHRITTTFVVPTMLNRICSLPEEILKKYDVSSLRLIIVTGEAFPFALKKKAVEIFGNDKIYEMYGGTELSCVTFMIPEEQLKKPGSCGKAAPGVDIKLLDENNNEVQIGEVGKIYVKSSFLLSGYHENHEATKANYYDGYFTVGDMASMDKDGYYYIADRDVDMVISGGVNIYPAEIEEVLHSHKDVYDASVIGVPDQNWGERLVAYVVPKENSTVCEQDITDYVKDKLASHKKPKEVIFIDEIPSSTSGKKLKRVLREQYALQEVIESPGKYDRSMMFDDRKRTYRVYMPVGFTPGNRLPLVLMLHGGQMTGLQMERITGWSDTADEKNFVVVYPDAIGTYKDRLHWNDCRIPEVDDVSFLSALIDELIEKANVDPSRVYVTGYSNGGGMAIYLAAAIANKITAIAPVSATIFKDMDKKWHPDRSVPVIYFHGTSDVFAYYEGGTAGTYKGASLSSEEFVQWWVDKNGCDPEPVYTELEKGPSDLSIKCYVYGKGREEVKVVFYKIEEGGHTWPGRPKFFPEKIFGKTAVNLDANEIIWKFFRDYKLPENVSS
ncbi:MAG: AMP-binding protein [Proteobacteria bacterium]|nr:AMP-binding protein [Pseudomonadota bacterium]